MQITPTGQTLMVRTTLRRSFLVTSIVQSAFGLHARLIYYNKLDKGGHFAAWEQPQLFASEVRVAFRSLR